MISAEDKTILGPSIRFKGDLSGADDLVLLGDFEGSIQLSTARLTIGPGAHIRASIAAQDVTVMGRVEGEIRSAGSVSLRATSVVLGNVFASRLSIEAEAVLRGQVDPARAGEPFPAKMSLSSATLSTGQGLLQRSIDLSPSEAVTSSPMKQADASAEMPAGLAAAARHLGNTTADISAAQKQPAAPAATKLK